jgi:hypothetical protein
VIHLDDEDSDLVDAMLRFLYKLDYASTGMINSDDRLGTVISAINMYGIADLFDIPELCASAKRRVTESFLSEGFKDDVLARIIEAVYNVTPSTDRGLRDVVAAAACNNLQSRLQTPAFAALLETADGFAADLVRLLAPKLKLVAPKRKGTGAQQYRRPRGRWCTDYEEDEEE